MEFDFSPLEDRDRSQVEAKESEEESIRLPRVVNPRITACRRRGVLKYSSRKCYSRRSGVSKKIALARRKSEKRRMQKKDYTG